MAGIHVPALLDVVLLASGLLYLILLSGPLDWTFVSIIATVRVGFSISTVLKATILGLLSAALILLQPHRYLTLLFDGTNAAPGAAGRPVLIKCKTTHRRIFPKKHAFAYSYLVAGIPVGWNGRTGGILAVDIPRSQRGAWFEVKSEDHLHRGGLDIGLRGKLNAYLSSQVSNHFSLFSNLLTLGIKCVSACVMLNIEGVGHRFGEVSLCLFDHGAEVPRIRLQSGFLLVSI